jgi:hypothetical protein
VVVLASAACTSPDDSDVTDKVCFPDEKCDSITDSGGVVPTDDRATDVLGGFNVLTERSTPTCVRPLTEAAYIAGQSSESIDVAYLANHRELSIETSTALGVGIDLGGVKLSALHELVQNASTSSTSVNLLVRMHADYWVMQRNRLALEGWAGAKLTASSAEFVKACGTHYAAGARYGGYVYVLATFEANDRSTIDSVKTQLGLNLFGIVPLTTTLSQKVTTVASMQNVRTTMRFAAEGFMLDGRPASAPLISTLLGMGIGPEFFTTLDHIREQLEVSVNEDKCRDGGIGQCAGLASPGFERNTLRNARPTAILAGYYDRLSEGVPAGSEATFTAMHDRIEQSAAYLKGLKGLEGRIDTVFEKEIEPALFYSNPGYLQVLPPAAPKQTGSQVREVTKAWAARLGPEGTVRQPIRDAAKACIDASVDLQPCAGADSLPDSAATKAVDAELAKYNAEGRVLPIRYTMIVNYGVDESRSLNICPGGSFRPTPDQARFIAPLIGVSSLHANTTWTQLTAQCGSNWDGWYADAYSAHHTCIANGWFTDDMAGVICLPTSGDLWKNWD